MNEKLLYLTWNTSFRGGGVVLQFSMYLNGKKCARIVTLTKIRISPKGAMRRRSVQYFHPLPPLHTATLNMLSNTTGSIYRFQSDHAFWSADKNVTRHYSSANPRQSKHNPPTHDASFQNIFITSCMYLLHEMQSYRVRKSYAARQRKDSDVTHFLQNYGMSSETSM